MVTLDQVVEILEDLDNIQLIIGTRSHKSG